MSTQTALTLKAPAKPLQMASAYIFAMGVATIIRKNIFAYTFEPKIWDCSGFLMIRIQNVRKSNSNLSYS